MFNKIAARFEEIKFFTNIILTKQNISTSEKNNILDYLLSWIALAYIYLTECCWHIISMKNYTCKHMDLIKYGISIDLLNKMKDQYNMDNTFSSKQHLDFCNLRYPKTWLSNNSCWIHTLCFYCISNWLHIVWTKMHILSFKNQISRSCKINK